MARKKDICFSLEFNSNAIATLSDISPITKKNEYLKLKERAL